MKNDLTVEILKQIRDEVKHVRDEVKQTNVRLDATRDELRGEIRALRVETTEHLDTLSTRVVESEIRTATALTDLAGSVREVTTLLREQHDLRPRVERCESEIAAIKQKLPAA